MSNILCFIFYDHMSGEFTSILDTYHNLKKYKENVDIFILAEKNQNCIQLFNSLPKDILINFYNPKEDYKKKFEKYNCVICSAYYFFAIAQNKISNFFQNQKILILDSSSFIISKINNIPIFEKIQEQERKSELFIFGNPFNKQFFKNQNYIEYYHKLDFNRLDRYKKTIQILEKFQKEDHVGKNPLVYSALNYFRNVLVHYHHPKKYYENIGKCIFEMLYLERPVFYRIKNKSFDCDGLSYYLKLFNIDDTKDQHLIVPSTLIKQKLSFQPKDEVMCYVNR